MVFNGVQLYKLMLHGFALICCQGLLMLSRTEVKKEQREDVPVVLAGVLMYLPIAALRELYKTTRFCCAVTIASMSLCLLLTACLLAFLGNLSGAFWYIRRFWQDE